MVYSMTAFFALVPANLNMQQDQEPCWEIRSRHNHRYLEPPAPARGLRRTIVEAHCLLSACARRVRPWQTGMHAAAFQPCSPER